MTGSHAPCVSFATMEILARASAVRFTRFSLLATLCVSSAAWAQVTTVQVDASVRHQVMEGFGATTHSLVFGGTDDLSSAQRAQAIDALYGQVRLNMGNLQVTPFEALATDVYSPANDNDDPKTLNAAGFNWQQSDNMFTQVLKLGRPLGFDNFYLGPVMATNFEFACAKAFKGDANRYLEECAEHVLALALHWRDAYGINPGLMQLWNEPIGGNGEMPGSSVADLASIIARAGARLRSAGFSTRFVIPADETEQLSLDEATAILADPAARPYVGAIAYHPYPYGSTYAAIPKILATSGAGTPDASKVAVRQKLGALGAKYGVPLMMVEVSHSKLAWDAMDALRGRAMEIHDELVSAAAAFFGMKAPSPRVSIKEDTGVLIKNADAAREVHVQLSGAQLVLSALLCEQSAFDSRWKILKPCLSDRRRLSGHPPCQSARRCSARGRWASRRWGRLLRHGAVPCRLGATYGEMQASGVRSPHISSSVEPRAADTPSRALRCRRNTHEERVKRTALGQCVG